MTLVSGAMAYQLAIILARREVANRFQGTLLGWLWLLLPQVLMLLIFAFVFGVIFQARWGQGYGDGFAEFAVILFAGLAVFNCVAECLNRAPQLLLEKSNYVKQVVFPLQILPLVTVLSAATGLLAALAVLLVGMIAVGLPLQSAVLGLPLILLPLLIALTGICWFLTATGVYLRDTSQLMTPLSQVLLFLSPIFYPLSALPESYRQWYYLNPMTYVVEWTRQALFENRLPSWDALLVYWLVALLIAATGWLWFAKLRKGFADVL